MFDHVEVIEVVKLLKQGIKVIERIFGKQLKNVVKIDSGAYAKKRNYKCNSLYHNKKVTI